MNQSANSFSFIFCIFQVQQCFPNFLKTITTLDSDFSFCRTVPLFLSEPESVLCYCDMWQFLLMSSVLMFENILQLKNFNEVSVIIIMKYY